MKPLYVIIEDGGDGSSSVHYTFNQEFMADLQRRYDNDEFEHGDLGVDGDGFHYDKLIVPDECTLQSLGIRYDAAATFAEEEEDEDEA